MSLRSDGQMARPTARLLAAMLPRLAVPLPTLTASAFSKIDLQRKNCRYGEWDKAAAATHLSVLYATPPTPLFSLCLLPNPALALVA